MPKPAHLDPVRFSFLLIFLLKNTPGYIAKHIVLTLKILKHEVDF